MKKLLLILLMSGAIFPKSNAQDIVVKSNLLYDLTTTLNLGAEIGLDEQWTLDLPINLNPWKFNGTTGIRHWGIQPEVKYWFNERFDRSFIGLHTLYSDFNVGEWSLFSDNMQNNRYQGHLFGIGFSYGYVWKLNNRWLLEASLGIGYVHTEYEKYPCTTCGSMIKEGHKNYFGPTKMALSLIYIIKQKQDEKENKINPYSIIN